MDERLTIDGSTDVPMLVLSHRTRVQVQRTVQVCSGLLVACVVIVCVLTLLTTADTRSTVRRRVLDTPVNRAETIQLQDIFISVKTASKFHNIRLPVILKTWYNLAPQQIIFFTDRDDEGLRGNLREGGLVPTPCPLDHSRHALVCKMQHEFNAFLHTDKKWFCHFDDDQYVNVPRLVQKLQEFPVNLPWYLGKPSIENPLEIINPEGADQTKLKFWFGTGGAGFCLSRPLADKISRVAGGREFITASEKLRLPDDVTMGYIVEVLGRVELLRLEEFHSHLEQLSLVEELEKQISYSYSSSPHQNLLEVPGFSLSEDPTRFLSLHCYLFPGTSWCDQM